jgi:outer membrane lipoprotein-sorting protein
MRVRFDAALLILVLCLCWWTAGAEPPADARAAAASADVEGALGRLEERMSAVQTLTSGFVQEKRLAVLQQPLVLKGTIYMEKPALFAWHVREPVRYSMVIRDDVVRQWDEDTQRVQRITLSKNPAFKMVLWQMRGWFSGAYKSMLGEYEVRVLNETPVSLEFVPREGSFAEAAIESVTVVFGSDERYIREMHIAEKGGDSTLLSFVDTLLNAPIDPSAWQVEPRVQ